MLQPERTFSTGRIEAASVAAFLDAMAPHEVRVLAGLDAAALADLLATAPPTRRPVLRLVLAEPGDAAARIARATDTLSGAAAGLWPFLWDGEGFSQAWDDADAHLATLAARHSLVPRMRGCC